MARRHAFVVLGLPHSGAGRLVAALDARREALAALPGGGVHVPWTSAEERTRATAEILRTHRDLGLERRDVEGTWATLCRRAHRAAGPVVVGDEWLAAATADQAALLLDGLSGLKVHLVVVARDLGAQVAGGWAHVVRTSRATSLATYQKRVLDPNTADPEAAAQFWAGQDLPAVLERWGSGVRPDRVHVLVPPRCGGEVGTALDLDAQAAWLWAELAGLVGFDPAAVPLPADPGLQRLLGPAELGVLQRVNDAVEGRLDPGSHRQVVQAWLADEVLAVGADRDADAPAVDALAPEVRDLALTRAETWRTLLDGAPADVHGDTADLLPVEAPTAALARDEVSDADRLRVATAALSDALVELARLREANAELDERVVRLRKKRKKLKQRLADLTAAG